MTPIKSKDSTTIKLFPTEEKVLEERLSHHAIKGGFWVFTLRITQQGFNLVRIIILARILAPYDFGSIAVKGIAINKSDPDRWLAFWHDNLPAYIE